MFCLPNRFNDTVVNVGGHSHVHAQCWSGLSICPLVHRDPTTTGRGWYCRPGRGSDRTRTSNFTGVRYHSCR
jgi:hypothetical protein